MTVLSSVLKFQGLTRPAWNLTLPAWDLMLPAWDLTPPACRVPELAIFPDLAHFLQSKNDNAAVPQSIDIQCIFNVKDTIWWFETQILVQKLVGFIGLMMRHQIYQKLPISKQFYHNYV